MQQGNQVSEVGLFSLRSRGRVGDVELVHTLSFAEVSQPFGGVRSAEDGRALPNPKAVNQARSWLNLRTDHRGAEKGGTEKGSAEKDEPGSPGASAANVSISHFFLLATGRSRDSKETPS